MVKVGTPGSHPPRSWTTAYWRRCTSCCLLLTTSKESYLATLPVEHPVLALGSSAANPAPGPLVCALCGCTNLNIVTQSRFIPPTDSPRDYTEYFCCSEHSAVDVDSDDDCGVCAFEGCRLLTSTGNTPCSMYCFHHVASELPSTPPGASSSSSTLPGSSAP